MKTKRKTNDTMPSSYFNRKLLSSDKRRRGSDNPDDAVKIVGRKYCRWKKGHRGEGVLIYGQTTCGISSTDYRTVHNGGTLEASKHVFIIVNSLYFHLCFIILHIEAGTWTKRLFQDFLNLGETNTTESLLFYKKFKNRIDDRRRSPSLVPFAEHWVTRLTEEDRATLSRLNNDLTEEGKIRVVYLVLKHGWDFVLRQQFITAVLPKILKLTVDEFKDAHVVDDVNFFIQRSTTLYGQYFDELDHDRDVYRQLADAVIIPVASEENSNDNKGDDNNNDDSEQFLVIPDDASSRSGEKLDEDSSVLSISSSTNNKTGKRTHEEDNDDDDNGDDDDGKENRSKPEDVHSISSSTSNGTGKRKRGEEDSYDNNQDDNNEAGGGGFGVDSSMVRTRILPI